MATNRRRWSAPGGLTLLEVLACVLPAARADEADPAGRYARLSDEEGAVSLEPAGVQECTAASHNLPLTTGDRLWADQSSRAELDLGDAALRLGSRTGVAFLNLDDNTAQMQLTAGTLIVHVRDMWASQRYEVDTPNVAVTLQQPGDYRLEVSEAGDTTLVRVSDGSVQATGGGQTIVIGMQQQVTFAGSSTLSYASATLGPPDDLDNWSAAREREREDSASAAYVADDVPGTQDLDDNGRWQETPEYGYVWTPTAVVVGWVPYRFGHWLWITPYGWTWVDDARWGYAPFHYGRWVQWHNTWSWVPGPRQQRPVYAPAMVAWVGGPAMGASSAFASDVGWFPLGPHEVYVPAYRVSASYVRNVNVTNTTIVNSAVITNIYQNNTTPTHYVNNRPAAVTVVPQNIFTSGQRVSGHAAQLPAGMLAGALVTAPAPAIAPIRQSVLGTSATHTIAQPPPALTRRTVVARTTPPPAPVPFDVQLAAVRANDGRPLSRGELAHLQPTAPAAPVKVIATAGPLISAGALARAQGNASRPQSALPPTRTPPPSPARPNPAPPPASLPTYAPPAPRGDRPPSAQSYAPSVQQRPFPTADSAQANSRPSSLPVYHPPGGPDPGLPDESARTDGNRAAHPTPPPPPAPRAQQPAHLSPPPPKTSSSEPRDAAPHGDRDSRERVER
jgi:hypothetical protein